MTFSRETREWVERRAQGACEYCRLPQNATVVVHQIDHVIGRQHRGSDDLANLCLCCIRCNLKKGPNIASIDPDTQGIVPLYHPRLQIWHEHFVLRSDGKMEGQTSEGRATVLLLDMNDNASSRLRRSLLRRGRLP